MRLQDRLGVSSRLMRQPATLILMLGSITAVVVGGNYNSSAEQKQGIAAGTEADPAIARLKAYAASKEDRFPQSHAPAVPDAAASDLPDVATMAARLEARLSKEPGDAEGWRLLGLSRAHLGNGPGAVEAYARALELNPGDTELTAALEEAKRATGTPVR